jgi:PST family polysaccharide transporter
MDYQKLVIRDSILQLIAAVISVVMALTGWGIWSLVVPGLLIAIPSFILVLWMSHWIPTLPLRRHHWGEIFSFTKHIIGSTLLGQAIEDGDTLVIGKLVGSYGLAIYDRAWKTSNLITKNIVWVISDVAMPAFSSLTTRLEALRTAYGRVIHVLAIISFPPLVGMFILAEEFILVLYGPKWMEAIWPLRIFIIYAMQRAIGSPVGVIYNSMGRPDIGLKINLFVIPFYFGSIFLGAPFGIVGIAAGVTLVKTVSGFTAIYLACRLIGSSYVKTLRNLWPPLEASFLMGLAALGTKIAMDGFLHLTPLLTLIGCTIVGCTVYLLLLLTRYTGQLEEILFVLDSLSKPISLRIRMILRRPLKTTAYEQPLM